MLEILFYAVAVLIPLLIPIALVVWALQRPVKRKLANHRQALLSLRESVESIEKGLAHLAHEVRILRSAKEAGAAAPAPPEEEPAPAAALRSPAPGPLRPEKPPDTLPTPEPVEAAPPEPTPPPKEEEPAEVLAEPDREVVGAVEARAREMRAEEIRAVVSSWEALTQRFLENWTGIHGSIVLVAGIGFLGTYAALHVSPAMRFLMVLAAAVALFGAYYPLHRHEKWHHDGDPLSSPARSRARHRRR